MGDIRFRRYDPQKKGAIAEGQLQRGNCPPPNLKGGGGGAINDKCPPTCGGVCESDSTANMHVQHHVTLIRWTQRPAETTRQAVWCRFDVPSRNLATTHSLRNAYAGLVG